MRVHRKLSRRQFARRLTAAVGPLVLPSGVLAAPGRPGANDRIRTGHIGLGPRGLAHLDGFRDNVVALCDVDANRLEQARHRLGHRIACVADYRELLQNRNVDAVVIATPDHWHALQTIHACQAGKDVYVEKPMSLTVEEANEALDLARQNERVVQVGTQRRSEGRWKAARKLIESGQVGPITRVSSANYFNHPRWARDFSDCKEDAVDWDAYLFNRPKVAFDPRLLRRWHLYRMCTNGLSGLWMTHLVDALHNVMGATYPNSAVALGGIYLWKDGREHSDVFHALLDYPEGFIYDWGMGLTNGAGTHYTIHGRYGTIDMEKQTYSGEGGEQGKEIAAGSLEAVPDENHMANWLDCIRSRQRPTADIAFGHQHSVATIMAAAALDTGQRMRYDRDQRKISAG